MADTSFTLSLTLQREYGFAVDFGLDGVPDLTLDEPLPLGEGHGPNAARLIAAAVGNCLAASLAFCVRRSRIQVNWGPRRTKASPRFEIWGYLPTAPGSPRQRPWLKTSSPRFHDALMHAAAS